MILRPYQLRLPQGMPYGLWYSPCSFLCIGSLQEHPPRHSELEHSPRRSEHEYPPCGSDGESNDEGEDYAEFSAGKVRYIVREASLY